MDLLPLETLANATALTTTLAAHGNALSLNQSGDVALALIYAVDTGGTGVEYVIEASLVDEPTSGDWIPLEEILDTSGTAASGSLTAPSSRLVRQITTAQPSRLVVVGARGCRWLRVKAKETTGSSISAAGTLTVHARIRIG